MTILPHAKDRAVERISKGDLQLFVRGVEMEARRGNFYGMWIIRVQHGKRVLGYAVGRGKTWETTLSAGMTPRDGYDLRIVRF